MIKILHTGDIHLDSSFSGLDARHAEVRRNELRAAFTSMMTYARMNSADLILIAGDVFDGDYVGRETIALLVREFEKFGRTFFSKEHFTESVDFQKLELELLMPDGEKKSSGMRNPLMDA